MPYGRFSAVCADSRWTYAVDGGCVELDRMVDGGIVFRYDGHDAAHLMTVLDRVGDDIDSEYAYGNESAYADDVDDIVSCLNRVLDRMDAGEPFDSEDDCDVLMDAEGWVDVFESEDMFPDLELYSLDADALPPFDEIASERAS